MSLTKWQGEGHCKVSFRDNSNVSLARSAYKAIYEHWTAGRAFGTYMGLYGYMITIKLAEVNCIMDCTPESVAEEQADNELFDKQQSLK